MRERGAHITDIIILVVAINDGVKPQTIESIRHIKNSSAQVLVAINKSDLEGFYPETVKGQLAEAGLLVSGFGGDVECLEISAKTGQGVDKLLETLLVMAELANYQADPEAPLKAVVVESTLSQHRGSLASVIVQQGTLKLRQELVVEGIAGRVKALVDENGRSLGEVKPGFPAEIVGLTAVPPVGALFRKWGGIMRRRLRLLIKLELLPLPSLPSRRQKFLLLHRVPILSPTSIFRPLLAKT